MFWILLIVDFVHQAQLLFTTAAVRSILRVQILAVFVLHLRTTPEIYSSFGMTGLFIEG